VLIVQVSAVSVEDYGRDLVAIQGLQRKQEDVEKDMTALFQQIQVR
jgi:spectrin beta